MFIKIVISSFIMNELYELHMHKQESLASLTREVYSSLEAVGLKPMLQGESFIVTF